MRFAPTAHLLLAATILIPLAGCGKSDEVKLENASVDEVANATRATGVAPEFKPGQWRTTTEFVSLDLPGAPDGMADQMRSAMSKVEPVSHCMTPEEAKKPREAFSKDNGDCRYDRFEMSGGKIDAVMRCQAKGQAQSMTMSMSGAYKPESYEMAAEMKIVQPQLQGKEMTMRVKINAERTGDCAA